PRSNKYSTVLHPVSDILGLLSRFLPSSGDPWISAYESDPGRFLVAVLVIVGLMLLSARLGARIVDTMGEIWEKPSAAAPFPNNFVYRLRTHPIYQSTLRSI